MNCEKAERWMSREFDDALDERRIELLNEHLAVCARCRAVREQWLKLRSVCRTRRPIQTPAADVLWADVRRAIRSETRERVSELRPWWRALAIHRLAASVAVAAALLAAGLFHVWRTSSRAPRRATGPAATIVEYVETALPGAAPMVYQDSATGWTIIWVVEANQEESGHADS